MAEPFPAGWYPQQDGTRRYWNGIRWTEHVAPEPPAPACPSAAASPAQSLISGGAPAAPSQPGYEPPFNRDDPRWQQPGYGQQAQTVPAQCRWYPDPFGRHELRWWDGHGWTQHVASQGRKLTDPPVPSPPRPALQPTNASIVQPPRRDVQRQVGIIGVGKGAQLGVGPLFTEPVLVVNQKAKLFEVKAEYAVYNQQGQQIGKVRQIGENFLKKQLTPIPEENRARRLQIVDMNDQVVLAITRPAMILKSTVTVTAADGTLVGQIVQKNLGIIRNVHLDLVAGGRRLGSLNAEDWYAWDFNVTDMVGNEIARITKTWAGMHREWFTKADHYVVQIHRPVEGPLRSLLLATALAIDIVFRQGNR